MTKGIAISGCGIICAIGNDVDSVADSLKRVRSGVGSARHLKSGLDMPVGEIKFSDAELKCHLELGDGEEYSRTELVGAVALREAMKDAGVSQRVLSEKRIAFVSATTVGGMDLTERYFRDMFSDEDKARMFACHENSNSTGWIASLCGLSCEQTTISTACSSALNAIILGARMLLTGEADMVFAGGTEALSLFHLNGFNSLHILDNEHCRPFDVNRGGLNLGEGAAYVVMERSDDAVCRGASIWGYVAGWGNRCDAFHQTASSDNGEGAYLAMKDALEMSGIDVNAIDYVSAHGTGTPDNDKSESAAMRRLFGGNLPKVSSTKGFTGHTTSASGSIETVICLIAMRDGFIPANLGWERRDEACIIPFVRKETLFRGEEDVRESKSFNSFHIMKAAKADYGDDTLNTATGAVREDGEETEVCNVLCNAFGFGGNDSSLLLTKEECPLDVRFIEDGKSVGEHTIIWKSSDKTNATEYGCGYDFSELKQYIPAIQQRRMDIMTKAAMLTSYKAMESACIDKPDAIVIATRYGMLEAGEKILRHLCKEGEDGISPTLFMQSTHNTIAGMLAIRLGCHGYNITYSHGDDSLQWAIRDANRLISEGKAKTVLVGVHDYFPEGFREIMGIAGMKIPFDLYSKSMVIMKNGD